MFLSFSCKKSEPPSEEEREDSSASVSRNLRGCADSTVDARRLGVRGLAVSGPAAAVLLIVAISVRSVNACAILDFTQQMYRRTGGRRTVSGRTSSHCRGLALEMGGVTEYESHELTTDLLIGKVQKKKPRENTTTETCGNHEDTHGKHCKPRGHKRNPLDTTRPLL